jgi:hypothetical protein
MSNRLTNILLQKYKETLIKHVANESKSPDDQVMADQVMDYNTSFDEIKKWKYCGGNGGKHSEYFKSMFDTKLPRRTNYCLCGQYILGNYYITDGNDTIVLGRCCIETFVPNKLKICERCHDIHTNVNDIRCDDCMMFVTCSECENECELPDIMCDECSARNLCKKCNRKCDNRYEICYNCAFNNTCNVCGARCNDNYDNCFECNTGH